MFLYAHLLLSLVVKIVDRRVSVHAHVVCVLEFSYFFKESHSLSPEDLLVFHSLLVGLLFLMETLLPLFCRHAGQS